MDQAEQDTICTAIAQACMWGHGGIGSVIIDKLDASMPMQVSWSERMKAVSRVAKHKAVGVVNDNGQIERLRGRGYSVCNYSPGELQIHNPRQFGGGLYKYILGGLADELGPLYDPWNFRVHQERAKQDQHLSS